MNFKHPTTGSASDPSNWGTQLSSPSGAPQNAWLHRKLKKESLVFEFQNITLKTEEHS